MSRLRAVTLAFFTAYFVLGVSIHRDFGLSWDEEPTREFGVMYVQDEVPDLRTLDSLRAAQGPAFERFGPLFELMLVNAEKFFDLTESRAIFFMRHLVTFLTFFIGVLVCHELYRRRFGEGVALLAAVSLVASPQLFSHAFYNTKDIAFLTGFAGAMLALDSTLTKNTWRANVVLGVVLGGLMGLRVLGLFAVMIAAVTMVIRRPTKRTLVMLLAQWAIILVLLPVVWPVLRIDPIGVLKGAVLGSTANPYTQTDLFRGRTIPASDLPWDYVPTWIAITTPMVLTVLFLVGAGVVAAAAARQPRFHVREQQRDLIAFGWFFVPVLGTVVLRPIMYDGWRHLFFVYPAFIYLAAAGMAWVVSLVVRHSGERWQRVAHAAGTAGLLLGLMPAVWFMAANHPYEHLYFNRFAGGDMQTVKQRFELDYWGLSYRETLEWIARNDPRPQIMVLAANYPGIANLLLLPPKDAERIKFSNGRTPADYFITNYRFHPADYPGLHEVYRVRVGNAAAASVFRRTAR